VSDATASEIPPFRGPPLVDPTAFVHPRASVCATVTHAAAALIAEGVVIPPNSLVLGVPGKAVRERTSDERARIARSVATYRRRALEHRDGQALYHPAS
jgi:carbonic anhydrase/acetyltransferase-like protein (isoleucine patch superfamily)